MKNSQRKYFIVKHGLVDFEAVPNFIWHTGWPERRGKPRGYKQIKRGDRWIAFAYTTSDSRERPLSLVTGFYECVEEARFMTVPRRAIVQAGLPDSQRAWMIRGRSQGNHVVDPVVVPPIKVLLKRNIFNQAAIIKITKGEYSRIREYTAKHRLARRDIPGLGREPRTEQEVVAIVAAAQRQLGIEQIIRVQTGFPDMLVKLKGKTDPIYLELELSCKSFLLHGQVRAIWRRTLKKDKKPVAVLCWHDDDRHNRSVRRHVHRVYELRSLLREKKRIRWR